MVKCHDKQSCRNIYTIPEIRESKSIPIVVAISGIEPEPIANFFLLLIPKYTYFNIISIFCYQTVIINILQTMYRCGYFLYIRHHFPDFLTILYTTKPQKPKFLGLISSIYSSLPPCVPRFRFAPSRSRAGAL